MYFPTSPLELAMPSTSDDDETRRAMFHAGTESVLRGWSRQ